MLRYALDLGCVALAVPMTYRASRVVTRAALKRGVGGMAAALGTYLLTVAVGVRVRVEQIRLDLVYCALVLTFTLATRGRWERLAYANNHLEHSGGAMEDRAVGRARNIAGLGATPTYLLLEFVSFGTIFS